MLYRNLPNGPRVEGSDEVTYGYGTFPDVLALGVLRLIGSHPLHLVGGLVDASTSGFMLRSAR